MLFFRSPSNDSQNSICHNLEFARCWLRMTIKNKNYLYRSKYIWKLSIFWKHNQICFLRLFIICRKSFTPSVFVRMNTKSKCIHISSTRRSKIQCILILLKYFSWDGIISVSKRARVLTRLDHSWILHWGHCIRARTGNSCTRPD